MIPYEEFTWKEPVVCYGAFTVDLKCKYQADKTWGAMANDLMQSLFDLARKSTLHGGEQLQHNHAEHEESDPVHFIRAALLALLHLLRLHLQLLLLTLSQECALLRAPSSVCWNYWLGCVFWISKHTKR
jgi:hypothetical protein